jgi:hypothetical protein
VAEARDDSGAALDPVYTINTGESLISALCASAEVRPPLFLGL